MYKKLLLLILFSFYSVMLVFSQALETGAGIGAMNYFGDISPYIHPAFFRPGIQLNTRWNFNNISTAKLNLLFGYITASDDKFDEPFHQKRELNFISPVLEASLQFEYNFLAFKNGKDNWEYSPFVFAGFGIFYFSPNANRNGEWISLQPIGTEGQGITSKKYSKIESCIPIGIGLKYSVDYRINMIFEFGIRKTFTDYLDDVSDEYFYNSVDNNNNSHPAGTQRGITTTDDWYLFTGVSLSYVFYWIKCPGFMY